MDDIELVVAHSDVSHLARAPKKPTRPSLLLTLPPTLPGHPPSIPQSSRNTWSIPSTIEDRIEETDEGCMVTHYKCASDKRVHICDAQRGPENVWAKTCVEKYLSVREPHLPDHSFEDFQLDSLSNMCFWDTMLHDINDTYGGWALTLSVKWYNYFIDAFEEGNLWWEGRVKKGGIGERRWLTRYFSRFDMREVEYDVVVLHPTLFLPNQKVLQIKRGHVEEFYRERDCRLWTTSPNSTQLEPFFHLSGRSDSEALSAFLVAVKAQTTFNQYAARYGTNNLPEEIRQLINQNARLVELFLFRPVLGVADPGWSLSVAVIEKAREAFREGEEAEAKRDAEKKEEKKERSRKGREGVSGKVVDRDEAVEVLQTDGCSISDDGSNSTDGNSLFGIEGDQEPQGSWGEDDAGRGERDGSGGETILPKDSTEEELGLMMNNPLLPAEVQQDAFLAMVSGSADRKILLYELKRKHGLIA